jgi:transcriptional regulator with XRE-family HTH domain
MDAHERLIAVREKLGLTQTELAKKVNISVQALNGAEKGRNGISDRILFPMKIYYKVNPAYVLTGKGDMFLSKPEGGEIPEGVTEDRVRSREYILTLQKKVKELTDEVERYKRIIDSLTQKPSQG